MIVIAPKVISDIIYHREARLALWLCCCCCGRGAGDAAHGERTAALFCLARLGNCLREFVLDVINQALMRALHDLGQRLLIIANLLIEVLHLLRIGHPLEERIIEGDTKFLDIGFDVGNIARS